LDVRGALDENAVARVERELARCKTSKPMPLYVNLNKLDTFNLKALFLLMEFLYRLRDSYTYIMLIDDSNKTISALQHFDLENILEVLFPDYPYRSVSRVS
jgi:hypothetical protein